MAILFIIPQNNTPKQYQNKKQATQKNCLYNVIKEGCENQTGSGFWGYKFIKR